MRFLDPPPNLPLLPENPYFFIENGHEHTWAELSGCIGKLLHEKGKISSPEARTIPKDAYGSLFGPFSEMGVGSNVRVRAERLRQLGWSPAEKSLEKSMQDDEIPRVLAQQ